jgi:hypothetical protein
MLLPVWMMAYRYKEHVFRFLINGQTGRATGQKPTSTRKILMAIVIGIVAVVLLILLMMICGGMVAAN